MNPISKTLSKYKSVVTSPLLQSFLIASALVPLAHLVKKPFYRVLRNVAADKRTSALTGLSPAETLQGIDALQNDFIGKHVIPWTVGLALPAFALATNFDPKAKGFGLTSWQGAHSPPMIKQQSLFKRATLFQTQGYQPQLDMSQQLNRYDAVALLQNNPILKQNSYATNLGTSIITAAPYTGAYTTLGGVYDSAVNKFQKKLQFEGLGSKLLKGAIAGSLSSMFTDVVGTVVGLPQPLRRNVANTAGIGKALQQILT